MNTGRAAPAMRIVELAHERRRFGYRRIGDLLRAAGTKINDKRVYRLYKLADLSVRKRRGKQRLKLERVPLHECQTINEVSRRSSAWRLSLRIAGAVSSDAVDTWLTLATTPTARSSQAAQCTAYISCQTVGVDNSNSSSKKSAACFTRGSTNPSTPNHLLS